VKRCPTTGDSSCLSLFRTRLSLWSP
jgi:hypothetical protein